MINQEEIFKTLFRPGLGLKKKKACVLRLEFMLFFLYSLLKMKYLFFFENFEVLHSPFMTILLISNSVNEELVRLYKEVYEVNDLNNPNEK